MNTNHLEQRVSLVARIGFSLAAFVTAAIVSGTGCAGGGEGDRCNPALSHNDCGDGLVCTQPPNCPENYCCPTTGTGSNPNCQIGCNGGGSPTLDSGAAPDASEASTVPDGSGDDGPGVAPDVGPDVAPDVAADVAADAAETSTSD